MFCKHCGAEVNDNAVLCVKCGCSLQEQNSEAVNEWLIALLLCFFLGTFGAHRFYVGKTGTAIVQLLTLGMCGIWTFVDFIMILCGNFTNSEGKRLKR